jgi:hypothetical protein
MRSAGRRGGGRAEFRVLGDGTLLWSSGIVTGKDAPKQVDLDLAGLRRLELVVTEGGDGYGNDHTDWADARLEVTGAAPKAAKPPDPSLFEIAARQMQDLRGRAKSLAPQTFRPDALVFESDRDPADAVLRRTEALLERLGQMPGTRDLAREAADLERLKGEAAALDPADAAAREALFDRAVALRRTIAFANPLLDFDKILFIKKHFLPGQEGLGNHMCDQYFGFHAIRQCIAAWSG